MRCCSTHLSEDLREQRSGDPMLIPNVCRTRTGSSRATHCFAVDFTI